MLVVRVVDVAVLMLHGFVSVRVLMAFGKMEIDAGRDQ
jgi:hypothetical protein